MTQTKSLGPGPLSYPFAKLVALCTVGLCLFALTACALKKRVIYERRPLPSEKKEMSREGAAEGGPVIEKRETKGVQYGVASWYGEEFHGKPTSSGEIYDMHQLTCAHNTLALGTTVIVTNLENGRSIELKVNDRGPFVKERIIDVSYAAARILGVYEKGTAYVKVETVGTWIEEVQRFHLQVGSFTDEVNAQKLADSLRGSLDQVYVATVETSTQKYYRVRIGPFDLKDAALQAAEKLSEMGFKVLVTSR